MRDKRVLYIEIVGRGRDNIGVPGRQVQATKTPGFFPGSREEQMEGRTEFLIFDASTPFP